MGGKDIVADLSSVKGLDALLREAFNAGLEQGKEEGDADYRGDVLHQTADEAFARFIADAPIEKEGRDAMEAAGICSSLLRGLTEPLRGRSV